MPMKRILIVDDNDSQRQFVRGVTEQFLVGWEIEDVPSAKEAEPHISPSLAIVVVDLYLKARPREGRGDGIDFLRLVRKAVPGCYTILVSYHAKNRMEMQLDDESSQWVDRFVSLQYVDSDPAPVLVEALSAGERSLFLA